MSGLVKPHGSDVLKPRLLEGRALTDELKRAQNLPRVVMQSRETGDLIMLGSILSPCEIGLIPMSPNYGSWFGNISF